MTLNLDLPYGLNERELEIVESNVGLSISYILGAINKHYKDGVSGSEGRAIGRIQKKLRVLKEGGEKTVELEISESELLRSIFKAATYEPQVAQYRMLLEDEINKD